MAKLLFIFIFFYFYFWTYYTEKIMRKGHIMNVEK